MAVETDKLAQATDLLAKALAILRELANAPAEHQWSAAPIESACGGVALDATGDQSSVAPATTTSDDLLHITQLLAQRDITVRGSLQFNDNEQGLLTLAHVIGRKYATVERLLHKIKQAQSSRRHISMDLSRLPQQQIADITLVAHLAHKAGLLTGHQYTKSPRYRLQLDAPRDPMAINFFTGQWLELFVAKIVESQRETFDGDFRAAYRIVVSLPNGDQFDLDAVLAIGQRLIWVEAKTTDDFTRHLRKYRHVSRLLCESSRDAILLWAGYENRGDLFAATRGAVAHMTLCAPSTFEKLLLERLTARQSTIAPLPR